MLPQYPSRGCENAVILHGPVVAVAELDLVDERLRQHGRRRRRTASLNLRSAPSASPDASSCLALLDGRSSTWASRAGGGGAAAESDAEGRARRRHGHARRGARARRGRVVQHPRVDEPARRRRPPRGRWPRHHRAPEAPTGRDCEGSGSSGAAVGGRSVALERRARAESARRWACSPRHAAASARSRSAGVRSSSRRRVATTALRSRSDAMASGVLQTRRSRSGSASRRSTSEMGGVPSASCQLVGELLRRLEAVVRDRARAPAGTMRRTPAAGRAACGSGTGSCAAAIAANVMATPWSVFHTGRPVRHSYAMQPSAQRSARWSTFPCPFTCSGRHVRRRSEDGALAREPRGLLVGLRRARRTWRGRSRGSSRSLRRPRPCTRWMFSGLRSRWTMPAACAFISPLATWPMMRTVVCGSMSRTRAMRS